MRHLAIMLLAAAALAAGAARAQTQDITEQEKAALTRIAQCMVAGLPQDWNQADMTIELPAPRAETGEVAYSMRRSLSGGESESFRPCDEQAPARALVEMRNLQTFERGGWKSARFTLKRDGTFDLKYDYPQAQ